MDLFANDDVKNNNGKTINNNEASTKNEWYYEIIISSIISLFTNYSVILLILAIVIAIIDALPILGTGTIMIPWVIISVLNNDVKLAVALGCLYLIVMISRQLLEPKIVGKNIGIHPIFTLIAMYTGFKIIGVIGMFIGPIILIILKNIFETMIDNGVVKTILDRK